jgi:protein subunit release factor B
VTDVQTLIVGSPGGQREGVCDAGVRIVHHDSGAKGECREHRSRHQNKHAALERLTRHPAFVHWVALRSRDIDRGESVQHWVGRHMQDKDATRVEIKDEDHRWQEVSWDEFGSIQEAKDEGSP